MGWRRRIGSRNGIRHLSRWRWKGLDVDADGGDVAAEPPHGARGEADLPGEEVLGGEELAVLGEVLAHLGGGFLGGCVLHAVQRAGEAVAELGEEAHALELGEDWQHDALPHGGERADCFDVQLAGQVAGQHVGEAVGQLVPERAAPAGRQLDQHVPHHRRLHRRLHLRPHRRRVMRHPVLGGARHHVGRRKRVGRGEGEGLLGVLGRRRVGGVVGLRGEGMVDGGVGRAGVGLDVGGGGDGGGRGAAARKGGGGELQPEMDGTGLALLHRWRALIHGILHNTKKKKKKKKKK